MEGKRLDEWIGGSIDRRASIAYCAITTAQSRLMEMSDANENIEPMPPTILTTKNNPCN